MTAVTVKLKEDVAIKLGAPLSTRVIMTLETPLAFATGVIVTVQFGAVPPKMILAVGKSVVLDDVALKFAEVQSKTLSISVIVNGTAAVAESSNMV